MDSDVDIYADLPSINLKNEQNDKLCKCEELNKKINELTNELEKLQKVKNTLEINFSSLLKTAKAEIVRKDKTIDDLRRRLDDTTFRRNKTNKFQGSSSAHQMQNQQYDITKTHNNAPEMGEIKSRFHQVEFYHDEIKSKKFQNDKNKKIQNDINQIPTVFGERMHKRIMETIKEEEEQKMFNLNRGKIAEENNKENGSRSNINKNSNKSPFITQNSDAETSYMKNSTKRSIEENSTYGNKRLKTDDKDETTSAELYHNCITQYDLKNNPTQFERTAAEDTKQNRSSNEPKKEGKSDSRKDYDSFNKKGSIDGSKSYRNPSTSNHISEGANNEYKNSYKYSPPRRHYSKSRSDHEGSGNHRLRERSSRIYKKYDDYEYSSRYRSSRLKKDYDSKEYDNNKSRYSNREHEDLRNRFNKHSSNDFEDNSSSNKYNQYKNRRVKESTPNVFDNKKLYENNKMTAIDLPTSFNRYIDTDQYIEHKTKNEPNIKFETKSSENSTMHTTMNLSNLEEGEILDSPEKKNNSENILKNNKIVNNNAKVIENKIKDDSTLTDNTTNLQNNTINTKKKVADIKISKVTSHSQTKLSEDDKKIIQTKSSGTDNATTNEKHDCNNDTSRSNKDSTDGTRDVTTIQRMCDNNINDDTKNHANKKLKNSIKSPTKVKDINVSNTKEANKIEKCNKSVESVIKEEKINNANIESIKPAELNCFNDNSNDKTKSEKVEKLTDKSATKIEIVLNCDTEDKNKTDVQDENESRNEVFDKSNVEMNLLCLSDHNYVRDPTVESTTNSDNVQQLSMKMNCKILSETIMSKETIAKNEMDVHSINSSETSSVVKNKKNNQQAKEVVISRRRRIVTLSDNSASMTVLMNRNVSEILAINHINYNDDDLATKPRLRTVSSRSFSKTNCK